MLAKSPVSVIGDVRLALAGIIFKENKMTLNQVVSKIAKKEGKRSEVKIGDVREIISLLSDMVYEEPSIAGLILKNGQRRSKIKVK